MIQQDRDFRHALRAAQGGDVMALEELWRRAGPRLDRYLHITAPERAEVVAAATWTTAAAGLRSFRGGLAAFRNVLVRVAREEVTGGRLPRRPAALTDQEVGRVGPLLVAAPVPQARPSSRPAGTSAALLAGLAPDVAEMVAVRVVGGLSTQETAGLLGTRTGFVIVAVHAGLRQAALAAYTDATGVALPDPWQLDRLLDRVVSAESGATELAVLNPGLRRLVGALTDPGPPGNPAQLSAARLVLTRCWRERPGVPASALDVVTAAGGPYVRPQPML